MPALKYRFAIADLKSAKFYETSRAFLLSIGQDIKAYSAMIKAFKDAGLKKPRHWIAGVKPGESHREGMHYRKGKLVLEQARAGQKIASFQEARSELRKAMREANRPFRNGLAAAEVREGVKPLIPCPRCGRKMSRNPATRDLDCARCDRKKVPASKAPKQGGSCLTCHKSDKCERAIPSFDCYVPLINKEGT